MPFSIRGLSSRRGRRRGGGGDPNAAVIAALQPALWCPFDEGGGATAFDRSGNGFHLTGLDIAGNGGWITGGFDFGPTNIYQSPAGVTAAALGLDGANPKTLVVVAKAKVNDGAGFGAELSIGSAVGSGQRWTFRTLSAADDLRIEIQGEGETETALSVADDTWSFASCKTSGATISTGSLSLNGTHVALSASSVTIDTATTARVQLNAANNAAGKTDLGYLLLFPAALSNADIDAVRGALTAIMAERGVTLP